MQKMPKGSNRSTVGYITTGVPIYYTDKQLMTNFRSIGEKSVSSLFEVRTFIYIIQ